MGRGGTVVAVGAGRNMKPQHFYFAAFLLLFGCSESDSISSGPSGLSVSSSQAGVSRGSVDADGACMPGTQRACGVTLDIVGNIKSCFRGVQTCSLGRWSSCENGTFVDEVHEASGESTDDRSISSLSAPSTCGDPASTLYNPCDPGCRFFAEDPVDISPSAPSSGCGAPSAGPGLCDFGLFSDSSITMANRSSTDAFVGAYGNVVVGTDAAVSGIAAKGDISFPSLNGREVHAPLGIHADGDIFAQNSSSDVHADLMAGGDIFVPAWKVQSGYSVAAEGRISGQNGTTIWGSVSTPDSITGVDVRGSRCEGAPGCSLYTPVSLPPQTMGRAIPELSTDCSGTLDVRGNGGSANVPGPGTYRDIQVMNNGDLILDGEGTYYFNNFDLNGGKLVLKADQGGAVGWDVRVCGGVRFDNDTKVSGAGGLLNDSNGVLLDPGLLSFYADSSADVRFGVSTYFSGVLIAPHARVVKSNVNNPPSDLDIESGTRAAPINGAFWAHELNLGTDAKTHQIPAAACEALGVVPSTSAGSCLPTSVVVEHIYEATCPTGSHPLWGLLAWDATTPGASAIEFSATTEKSEAEMRAGLAASDYFSIGEASQGTSDTQFCGVLTSCRVDLTAQLGLGLSHKSFLALRAELLPDGADSPTLHDWKISYSCQFDQ